MTPWPVLTLPLGGGPDLGQAKLDPRDPTTSALPSPSHQPQPPHGLFASASASQEYSMDHLLGLAWVSVTLVFIWCPRWTVFQLYVMWVVLPSKICSISEIGLK